VIQEQQQHKQQQPHPHLSARAALQWGRGMLPPTMADFDWLLSQVPGERMAQCCFDGHRYGNRSPIG